jgi:multiple sugar transport system permease protein
MIIYLALAFVFIFPFFWSAINSVKPASEAASSPPTYFPSRVSLENYIDLSEYGSGVIVYLMNSVIVAIMAVSFTVVLALFAGYGFARLDFPFKQSMFIIILSTMILPFQTIITPLFILMNKLSLSNSLPGLAIVYTLLQIAFGILVMRTTFTTIPKEIEEAARIDGCGSMKMIESVMIPLAKPGIVTVGIISFINSWNEFLASLIFISDETRFTLPVMVNSIRTGAYGAINWGSLQAGLVVSAVPCFFVFFICQKYYISGLTGGSVKG